MCDLMSVSVPATSRERIGADLCGSLIVDEETRDHTGTAHGSSERHDQATGQ
jgi:hypothetical protein